MHLASNFTGNLFLTYADQLEILRMVVIVVLGVTLCLFMEPQMRQVSLNHVHG